MILTAGQFTSTPGDQAVCVGTDMTLDWRFDHEGDLDIVIWYRDSTSLMTKFGSDQANQEPGITNVHHITNGEIKITGVSQQDEGRYTCSIYYTLKSGLSMIPPSRVNVTVIGKLTFLQSNK